MSEAVPVMRFHVLGPLTISDGTDAVVLQPSKPTTLLAALLLRPNTVVSADYLLRVIWGGEQPATAKAALQTCVLRLRRLFGKYGVTPAPVEAVPGGYRISAGEQSLDLIGFRERVRRASGAAGDPEGELYALKDALSQWQGGAQGSLLANVRSDVLHRDEVPRLTEERLRTVERVCDIELVIGRCGPALVELWSATRAYPGHERFREQLIEALYRTGRQAEALAEYRRIKAYLREELGVDPSPALQRLELAILRGDDLGPASGPQPPVRLVRTRAAGAEGFEDPADPANPANPADLADNAAVRPVPGGRGPGGEIGEVGAVGRAGVPASDSRRAAAAVPTPAAPAEPLGPAELPFLTSSSKAPGAWAPGPSGGPADRDRPAAASRSASSVITALPAVPSFTGRDVEAAAMVARLTAGKDGDPATILLSGAPGIGKTALARQVAHLTRDRFPGGQYLLPMVDPDGSPLSADTAAEELAAATGVSDGGTGASSRAPARTLMVLDDVVDADQVRPLLPAAPGSAAIVTSRMGLAGLMATHGGWVHRLTSFAEEESRALLVSVLGAQRVDAEPEAARRLCGLCGHYPLALRIVTARLLTRPGLGLADCARWLAEDPPARLSLPDDPQMSVEAVLGAALDRLQPPLAEVFRAVGTLPLDKFEAADCVGPLGTALPEAESALERLADAGLLEEGPPGPYRMHELLRTYARTTPRPPRLSRSPRPSHPSRTPQGSPQADSAGRGGPTSEKKV